MQQCLMTSMLIGQELTFETLKKAIEICNLKKAACKVFSVARNCGNINLLTLESF